MIFWFADPVHMATSGATNARKWSVNSILTVWITSLEWSLSSTRTSVVIVTAFSIIWAARSHSHAAWTSAVDDLGVVSFASLGWGLDAFVGWTSAFVVVAAAVRFEDLTFVWATRADRFWMLSDWNASRWFALAFLLVNWIAAFPFSSVENDISSDLNMAHWAVEDLSISPTFVLVAIAGLDWATGGWSSDFLLPSKIATSRDSIAKVLVTDAFSVSTATSHSVA